MLKVFADILCTNDESDLAVLTLLGMSAAFNAVDQSKLLRRLVKSFGLGLTTCNWFSAYLTYVRSLSIDCDGSVSRVVDSEHVRVPERHSVILH